MTKTPCIIHEWGKPTMDPVSNNIGESIYRQQCHRCGVTRPIHSPEVCFDEPDEPDEVMEFPFEWLSGFIEGDEVADKERISIGIMGFAIGILVTSVIFLLTIYMS